MHQLERLAEFIGLISKDCCGGSANPGLVAMMAASSRDTPRRKRNLDLQRLGDLEEIAGADAIRSTLVFLDLLKGNPNRVAQLCLADAQAHSPAANARSYVPVDWVRTSSATGFLMGVRLRQVVPGVETTRRSGTLDRIEVFVHRCCPVQRAAQSLPGITHSSVACSLDTFLPITTRLAGFLAEHSPDMTINTSPEQAARLALAFSCLGHAYSHLFAPIFYVVVLTLEHEYALTHGEAVALIVAATFFTESQHRSPAGWATAGARPVWWGCFSRDGAGMIATAWPVAPGRSVWGSRRPAFSRRSTTRWYRVAGAELAIVGKALGINGVFGGIGPAVAAVSAGALIDIAGWRAALSSRSHRTNDRRGVFAMLLRGLIVESTEDRRPTPKTGRNDMIRAFFVLSLTMLCTGLIYQATQPALPKLFTERVGDLEGGVFGVSMLVALVYLTSGGMQVLAGISRTGSR